MSYNFLGLSDQNVDIIVGHMFLLTTVLTNYRNDK